MHLRYARRLARVIAPLDIHRPRRTLPLLQAATIALLSGSAAVAVQAQPTSNDPGPRLILKEGCCFIPPDSPLANQTRVAPNPAPQAVVTAHTGPSVAPAQISPPAPVTATGAAMNAPPSAALPLNSEIEDEPAERGTFIDTLQGVLDGRAPTQAASSPGAPPSQPHPAQATDIGQRIARVTASLPWKVLEVLSVAFALGIAAAAAYFSTRRGSGTSD